MKLATFILVVGLLSPALGISQESSIYGTYQICPFHCLTININSDHTFVYRLNGDLYNNLKVRGTWKFKGRNRIHAVTPENRTVPNVEEKVSKRDDDFLVIVKDFTGAIVAGVGISGIANGSRFSVKTDNDGRALIPKARQFEIAFADFYRGVHMICNSQANEFTVTLTVDQVAGIPVNEEWLIKGNKLFIVRKDGSVNRGHPLVRLNRRLKDQ